MNGFSATPGFAHLSLADLLRAREQFHPHLVHKKNVVGTAVGRYLIRKEEPAAGQPKPARTFENSEVRENSWPCVLVLVDDWVEESAFGKIGELPASEYVPKTIYMEDGKAVPICLVYAPAVNTPPRPEPPPPAYEAHGLMQGGTRVLTTVQNVEHAATIGCLATDGHKVYALTSRHVAGELGEVIATETGVRIGSTSGHELGRVPFEKVYAPWPGRQVFVNFDVALVEVDDVQKWSSGIRQLGPIGPLLALSTYNLSLNLIGCPVRAFGAASGPLDGKIAALFYRYKSVGGFDYVADFLIGSRTEEPLGTLPGDSGAVWVVEDRDQDGRVVRAPVAVQWGGAVFGAQRTTFALAANLSTIARELDVDIYRGPGVAAFEYWGPVGHSTIGQYACKFVTNEKLTTLLTKNLAAMGRLANVPDNVWKGRKGREDEGATHYADIDYAPPHGKSLDQLTPDAGSLKTQTWRTYYDQLHWTKSNQRGLLPFRVWQVFKELVDIIDGGDVDHILAAMGVLAHYVGDSCQPLHGSIYSQGDPFRDPDGNPVEMRGPFDPIYGGGKDGVHSTYESAMVSAKAGEIGEGIEKQIAAHGLDLVGDGRAAGWAALELMRRSRERMDPLDMVETFVKADDPIAELWAKFGSRTIDTMVDGCRVLAMLWESAWQEGHGDNIDDGELHDRDVNTLLGICKNESDFLESTSLNDIGAKL